MAIYRAEREGTQLVHELEGRRGELERHQRETVEELEAAGYLTSSSTSTAPSSRKSRVSPDYGYEAREIPDGERL
jgi:hypothetical protein